MIGDMLSNNKLNSIVTVLVIRERKLNISIILIKLILISIILIILLLYQITVD